MKKSKFDPYINVIKLYLSEGLTIATIAEQLDQYFDDAISESALYSFISKNRLQYSKSRKFRVPNCNTCEDCKEVIDVNEKEIRMCCECRLVANKIKTSPGWCHKRERKVS